MTTKQLNRRAEEINADLALARSAIQPADIGTAAAAAATDFATAAQGAKADTALQPAAINDA
ncbi:MAG: hypothetical protein EOM21_20840, partial [Gammaproteobacteria bacterium]|nr:hypothetical protein [Gammaproteobacteria bacterium]